MLKKPHLPKDFKEWWSLMMFDFLKTLSAFQILNPF